jgi:hypothetical protein
MAEQTTDEGVKSFAAFVRDACDGDVEKEGSLEFWGLLEKIRATQERYGGARRGRFTLTFALAYDGKTLHIDHEVAVKNPKTPRQQGQAWLTKSGNYTFKNPRQQELAFPRDVSQPRPQPVDDGEQPRMAPVS